MQIICPECGTEIPSTQLDVQKRTAICPHCDAYFQVDPFAEKRKSHHQVEHPQELTLHKNRDDLQMRFRTNFNLEDNNKFQTALIATGIFFLLMGITYGGYLSEDLSPWVPFIFMLAMFGTFYWLLLISYNATQIVMNQKVITILRKPLPSLMSSQRQIDVADIHYISCEKIKGARKKQDQPPLFRVWAEGENGRKTLVVKGISEDYAYFIAQTLDEHLATFTHSGDSDYAPLSDDDLFISGKQ